VSERRLSVGDEWAERIERSLRWTYRGFGGLIFAVLVLALSLWLEGLDEAEQRREVDRIAGLPCIVVSTPGAEEPTTYAYPPGCDPSAPGARLVTCLDFVPVIETLRLLSAGMAEALDSVGAEDQAAILDSTSSALGIDACPPQ
jgi:hypothetical protein